MIRAASCTYAVGRKRLVDDVSLAVHPGEVVALVGANGAGKTTILRLLSGEQAPTAGGVSVDGMPIAAFAPDRLARRRAVLPQASMLAFDFTVRDVVHLGRTPHRTRGEYDRAVVRDAMRVAGVAHLADQYVPTLSGGERQRVHLARALAQIWDPEAGGGRYLLLDEPTASLDLAHQHQVLATAVRCAEAGVGVLTVLHDLNLAAQYADRIAVMRNGRLIASGTPGQVLTPDIIHQAFDIAAFITTHPCEACPLVVPMPAARTPEGRVSEPFHPPVFHH